MLDFCSCFISLPTCQPTHVSVIKDDWTLTGCQTCDPCKKKPPTPAKQHTWSTLPTIYKHVCSLCQDNVCRSNMRRHSVSHLNSCNGNSRTQQTPRNVHNWHHATTTFTEFVLTTCTNYCHYTDENAKENSPIPWPIRSLFAGNILQPVSQRITAYKYT